jgi:hypothetical protein
MYSVPEIASDTEPESKESGGVGRGKKMWFVTIFPKAEMMGIVFRLQ